METCSGKRPLGGTALREGLRADTDALIATAAQQAIRKYRGRIRHRPCGVVSVYAADGRRDKRKK